MTVEERFRPPGAAVADIEVDPAQARGVIIALGMAGLFQLAWVGIMAESLVDLMKMGVLRPIGLLFAVGGLGCLYLAMVRLALQAAAGSKLFVAAAILLAACTFSWWGGAREFFFAPFLLGALLACAGWWIASRPKATASATEFP